MTATYRTLSDLASIVTRKFADKIESQINRSTPLFSILPVKPASADIIKWVAKVGTAAPGTSVVADGADLTEFGADTKVPAYLSVGTYVQAIGVSIKAIFAAAASGNPAQLADLMRDEILDASERLAMDIATDCYVGTGATDHIMGLVDPTIGPLQAAVDYASVSYSSYGAYGWNGNVDANGTVRRALTLHLMRDMRRKIYVASGMHPDVIVCDPVTFEAYGELLGDKRRYLQDVTLGGRKIVLDGGFQALEFDGIPVFQDISCPAGQMLFLNTRVCEIQQLPTPTMAGIENMGEMAIRSNAEEQFNDDNTKLKALVLPLARAGAREKLALYCFPQIIVRRRNATGLISYLLTS